MAKMALLAVISGEPLRLAQESPVKMYALVYGERLKNRSRINSPWTIKVLSVNAVKMFQVPTLRMIITLALANLFWPDANILYQQILAYHHSTRSIRGPDDYNPVE